MQTVKSFKDFGIKTDYAGFTGEKIKISKVLNKEITVHAFKIEPSKFNQGNCLNLQISINDTMHIVFTGSGVLTDLIKKVPENGFPFKTTIIEENERYQFS